MAKKKKAATKKRSTGKSKVGPALKKIIDHSTGKLPDKSRSGNGAAPIELSVGFGSVSIQKSTARLPLSIERKNLGLEQCDELFTDRRLTGKVILGRSDDANGQKTLIDDMSHEVGGVFDVKGYRATSSEFKPSLTFSLKEIDVAELAQLAAGSGQLVITDVADIPEDAAHEEEEGDDDLGQAALPAQAPWRDRSMEVIGCPQGMLLRLEDNHIETLGDMAGFFSQGKKITSLLGMGPAAAGKLADLWAEYGKDHPEIFDRAETAKA